MTPPARACAPGLAKAPALCAGDARDTASLRAGQMDFRT